MRPHATILRALLLAAAPALAAASPRDVVAQPARSPVEITVGQLRGHLSVLAADSMEGRGAGYRGEHMAAAYIARQFERFGLAPMGDASGIGDEGRGYLQRFDLHPRRPPDPLVTLPSQNVIALLEGSDPALRDEVVVLGAHFDGQGMAGQADIGRRPAPDGVADSIWNGANDNASGVAALLAVAEALARGERPRRSILFIAFGAEEHGLVGSLHYVANPAVPWDRHVAMVNLEMIGWEPDRVMNVRATGTSHAWHGLLDRATERTGVPVTRIQPALTNDTDHYGFGVRGVPAIHYGVGGSREHYHAVSDVAEHIGFDALTDRSRHILALVREVADGPERVPFDWRHPRDLGITGVALTPAELVALGLAGDDGGVKVNAVAYGLPAAAAGVRPGDVVLAMNGRAIGRREPGMRLLAAETMAAADGASVPLLLLRNGERITVTVRFLRRRASSSRITTPASTPSRATPWTWSSR